MVNSSWRDLDVHGRRLAKILKILDKKFDRIPKDDIDGLARIAATIGNVTRQEIEIIKLAENFDKITKWFDEFDKAELKSKRETVHEMNNVIKMAERSDERRTKGR